jgi:reductive dehalogenase
MTLFLLVLSGISLIGLLWLHVLSRHENETIAARRSAWAALVVPLFFVGVALLPLPKVVPWLTGSFVIAGTLVLLIPTGVARGFADSLPKSRLDERTIMFSRAALKPDTEHFEKYYEEFPEHRENDDRFRRMPGLMSPASGKFERLSFSAADASFETVGQLAALVNGDPAEDPHEVSPAVVTDFLMGWMKKLGAVSSGVTLLKDEHLYTTQGRGEGWGRPIERRHRFAIAFSVEMDHRQMGTAPEGPTLMESSEQYLHAGTIATQVAVFIRNLGWPAEAHIDANYKVVCPLVGKDAGLGEIGRMGLLMTPELGPRVRLAVVTTDLPLLTNDRCHDASVLHFCSICRKCADICPPKAIASGDRQEISGSKRWRVDSEACFSYWCAMGTDCGQCMRVCPYSHPDTGLHNLVRLGLRNSALFRHFALKMDDLIYGRKPEPMQPAGWLPRRH